MTGKEKLIAIHKSLDEFLEDEKIPTEQIEIYIWDALDAIEVALAEWDIDWREKKRLWEQGKLIKRRMVRRRS